jgi:hypothetical protein
MELMNVPRRRVSTAPYCSGQAATAGLPQITGSVGWIDLTQTPCGRLDI